jgi:hypothetical protein
MTAGRINRAGQCQSCSGSRMGAGGADRHAWRNLGDAPVTMAFVNVGARRS